MVDFFAHTVIYCTVYNVIGIGYGSLFCLRSTVGTVLYQVNSIHGGNTVSDAVTLTVGELLSHSK